MNRVASFVLALGLIALPSVASADSFSARFISTGLGVGVKAYDNGTLYSVFAGQLRWDAQAGVDDFISYCVQLDNWLQVDQTFKTGLGDHISTEAAGKISYLVSANFSQVTDKWMAAGLQLAIWNVLYDSDLYASQGKFYSSTLDATKWADKYLGGLKGLTNPNGNARFLDSTPGITGQDRVTAVPEPGTLLLLGAGAIAVAARRRIRRAT